MKKYILIGFLILSCSQLFSQKRENFAPPVSIPNNYSNLEKTPQTTIPYTPPAVLVNLPATGNPQNPRHNTDNEIRTYLTTASKSENCQWFCCINHFPEHCGRIADLVSLSRKYGCVFRLRDSVIYRLANFRLD